MIVRIQDAGQGELSPIFFRLSSNAFARPTARKPDYGGLGLGLALVKSFVEAHNGTVTAESKGAGQGSRFTVRLPRYQN